MLVISMHRMQSKSYCDCLDRYYNCNRSHNFGRNVHFYISFPLEKIKNTLKMSLFLLWSVPNMNVPSCLENMIHILGHLSSTTTVHLKWYAVTQFTFIIRFQLLQVGWHTCNFDKISINCSVLDQTVKTQSNTGDPGSLVVKSHVT